MERPKGLPHALHGRGLRPQYRARGLCGMHYYRLRADTPIAGGERSQGEKHGNGKLTAQNVQELRTLHADGATLRQLADKFGVSNVSIYNAVSGKTWRHLDAGQASGTGKERSSALDRQPLGGGGDPFVGGGQRDSHVMRAAGSVELARGD